MSNTTEKITGATLAECEAIAHALKDRLFEISESGTESSYDFGDGTNGMFEVFQAAQAVAEATCLCRNAITIADDHAGRQYNAERDAGAAP